MHKPRLPELIFPLSIEYLIGEILLVRRKMSFY